MSSRMYPRRAGAVLAAVAVGTLLLTGCSEGAAVDAGPLTAGEVPEEEATLTVWSFLPDNYDGGTEAYDEVIAAFEEEYPQITVELDTVPYPKYFDQVRNATVARKGADVITMYGGSQAYSYRNGLYPLQDAMLPEIESDLKFVDDNYSPDGNLYILPTGTYGYSMLVNQDLFASAGIDPVEGLKDWESLVGTCRTLATAGIQPMAAGWKDGFLFETFMYMISSQMMDRATLDKWVAGEIPVDDELFVTATERIVELNEAGCFGGSDKLGLNMYDDAFNEFYAGQAAMFSTGSLSTAATASETVPSTTVLPLPQVPESTHEAGMIDAGAEAGWSVTKWTKHPEAAVAFVNFMASPEAQQILWDSVGVPPNLGSLPVEGATPVQQAFLPLMQNPENHTGFAAFPLTVLAVYERNAAPLISGDMSVETFTEQAQAAFEKSK
ncbi:ABC transporter substrate-binding protein [Agromyces sp. NPDC058484]|uniref:ABC transporter substrate-binding protein n=1 Tax=Agromyces sp. NPDC058484 TaxID=3346524 RepID=UPI00365E4D0D